MSLMSDVTYQVKHPPTGTIIRHSQGGGVKSACFFKSKMCANRRAMHVSSSLVGSSSSGSEAVEGEGLRTDCSTGNVVESCLTCQ